MQGKRNFEFERFVREAVSGNSIGGIAGIVLLAAMALFFRDFGIKLPFVPLIVMGLIPVGGIALVMSFQRRSEGQRLLD